MVSKKRVVVAAIGLLAAVGLLIPDSAIAQSEIGCYPTACPGPDAIFLNVLANAPLAKNAPNAVAVVGTLQGGPASVTGSLTSTTLKHKKGKKKLKEIQNPVTPASLTISALDGETFTFLFTTTPKKPKATLRGTTTAAGDINPSNNSGEILVPVR